MKHCALKESELNDHLDKRLSRKEALMMERHLEECPACRSTYEALVAIRERVQALPKVVEPERNLWPEIASRLAAGANQSDARPGRRQRIIRLVIAAAACLFVVVGAVLLLQRLSRPGTKGNFIASSGTFLDDNMRSEIAKAEKTYLDAAADFLAELDSDKALLTPEARKVLEGNLAITDQAISEVKLALKQRPSDFSLARKLLATHERRIELLQQATQLSFAAQNGG